VDRHFCFPWETVQWKFPHDSTNYNLGVVLTNPIKKTPEPTQMRKGIIFMFCMILLALVQADGLGDANTAISRQIQAARRSFARTTFSGKSAPTDFDPSNGDYWQGLGTLSIFGLVCALLAIIFAATFLRFRRCGLFGGLEPQKYFCWPKSPARTDVFRPLYLTFLALFHFPHYSIHCILFYFVVLYHCCLCLHLVCKSEFS
jgi:hypothetical protein